ncbi:MAG TPA: DUF6542 domain-containing protein [Candidatus Nanopelagicales bacterium]|nr:DUF6542 domain-containing protein [Candidatus Nanopelagicales bacterium]
MSDDHGAGAPSFGDLFDDPDAPDTPAAAAAAPVAAAASREAAAPARPEPQVEPPVERETDLVTGHDLDHGSTEADHLVAGFEHDDEPEAATDDSADDHGRAVPAAADGAAGVSVAASPWDGTVDPAVSSAPAARVDTGRLYRSAGAEGPATLDAIPALDPDRLAAIEAGRPQPEPEAKAPAPRGSSVGLTYAGVMVVVISATVVVALLEAVVRKEIGWLTGVALLLASVYAAVFVRRADIWAAVVAPPLAFLVATLTAGQLTLGSTGTLLEREGFMIFKSLAVNAPWILASTVAALVIVLVRRRRSPA